MENETPIELEQNVAILEDTLQSATITPRLDLIDDRHVLTGADFRVYFIWEDGRSECIGDMEGIECESTLIQAEGFVEMHQVKIIFAQYEVSPRIKYPLTTKFDVLVLGIYPDGVMCAERYNGLQLHKTRSGFGVNDLASSVGIDFKAESVDLWKPLNEEETIAIRTLYPELTEVENTDPVE